MPAPLQHPGQRTGVENGRDGGRHRRPDMPHRRHQRDVQRQVQRHRGHPDLDRGRGVAAREEAGGEHLDQHESGKPHAVGGQCLTRQPRTFGIEGAAAEQRPHDWVCRYHQGQCRRQRQDQRIFDCSVLRVVRGRGLPAAHLARQHRQQGGADGGTDHPQRQLLHPIGVIQQRHGAGGQQACDDHIDREIQLRHARPDQPRRHTPQQQADSRGHARARHPQPHPGPPRRPHQQTQLRDAGERDAPGQGMTGGRRVRREPQHAGNADNVEQHVGRGGGCVALHPVEDA